MTEPDSQNRNPNLIVVDRVEAIARRAQLSARLAVLDREATEVRGELAAIESVLKWFGAAANDAHGRTIREMAASVLSGIPHPMGVKSIIDAVQEKFGATVPRTSLSPILKKMERRGEVHHVGDKWTLAATSSSGTA